MKIILVMMSICASAFANITVATPDTDRAIEKTISQMYVFKVLLIEDDIKVEAKDGVVTLTGTVMDEPHKALAEEAVSSLPTVKSVNNNLNSTAGITADKADERLSRKVKIVLIMHRSVNGFNTTVSSKEGKVTLTGEAINAAQKQLTTEYAKDVEGVTKVNNEMTVAKKSPEKETVGEKIDDASITAQIKVSLLFHRSTSVLKTQVKTESGVVTLSGMAKNAAEIELVTKLVKDINGVTDVDNQMTLVKAAS